MKSAALGWQSTVLDKKNSTRVQKKHICVSVKKTIFYQKRDKKRNPNSNLKSTQSVLGLDKMSSS